MSDTITFNKLGLSPPVLAAVSGLGYEFPTPVQAAAIPVVLSGEDLVAIAQTGTGKTAAFALPILSQIDVSRAEPQALILAPTRELAVQVAEAFHKYAKDMPGFRVLAVYGGKNYTTQLKELKRGVHVIVGTPGRTQDHITRQTLNLSSVRFVVLDEADEMLNMGFQEEVEMILKEVQGDHQTVLFSATMPPEIRKIAESYLKKPQKIQIKSATQTVANTEQFCIIVSKEYKFEALTRYLEVEDYDAVLIFCKTKIGTQELAEKLSGLGYGVSAMNGDMTQDNRESVIKRFKMGKLDFIVATEVAARGLDVPRVSHVINYDLPTEVASYIHRIGRTGRAGRTGKALLFASPRERRMLNAIEQTTKQPIKIIEPPTARQVINKRNDQFKRTLLAALDSEELMTYRKLANDIANESNIPLADIAAAAMILNAKEKAQPELGQHDKFIHSGDVETSRGRSGDNKYGRKSFGSRGDGGGYRGKEGGGYRGKEGGGFKSKEGGGYKGKEGGGFKSEGGGYKSKEGSSFKPKEGGGYKGKEGSSFKPREGGGYKGKEGGGFKSEGSGYKGKEGSSFKPKEGGGYKGKEGSGFKPREGGGYKGKEGSSYKPREGGEGGTFRSKEGGIKSSEGGTFRSKEGGFKSKEGGAFKSKEGGAKSKPASSFKPKEGSTFKKREGSKAKATISIKPKVKKKPSRVK